MIFETYRYLTVFRLTSRGQCVYAVSGAVRKGFPRTLNPRLPWRLGNCVASADFRQHFLTAGFK